MNIKIIKARIRSLKERRDRARSIFLADGLTRMLSREQAALKKLTN